MPSRDAKTVRSAYTSGRLGMAGRVTETVNLLRLHRQAGDNTRRLVVDMRRLESELLEREEVRLQGQRMLDLGCGQQLRHALYFAQRNRVLGVDAEAPPRRGDVRGYLDLAHRHGPLRAAKTAARRALGADGAVRRALADELQVGQLVEPTIRAMEIDNLLLSDASFDVVYSMSVFEHVRDPARCLGEAVRVLRPGGLAYLRVHQWTSDSGAHDPRIRSGRRGRIPHWAHLRDQHNHRVLSNAYVNRWRLADWRNVFGQYLPGFREQLFVKDIDSLTPALADLRAAGELPDYSDEELLTTGIAAVWRKPS